MVPKKVIPPEIVTQLIRDKFKCKEVASLLGVSEITLKRRMKTENIKVREQYTVINDAELNEAVTNVLENHPNTGWRMMQGFLRAMEIRVTRQRIRDSIKSVDPIGVACRRNSSRLISRRVYFVQFSNEIWHLDTNLKLVRYKFVIKGCIDGKSRTSIYLDVADNNRSDSQLESFTQGVRDFGVPLRSRSDKGSENRGIAEFMLRNRGLNRASHICGRSVHNQRIERFWVDVYDKVILQYIITFGHMESNNLLDINNEFHMKLLHYVFLPRIQNHLQVFRKAWNEHGLSSVNSKTPKQLMMVNLPPSDRDLCIPEEIQQLTIFQCNNLTDAELFNEQSPITQPVPPRFCFSESQLQQLAGINVTQESASYGIDIYSQCFLQLLH